MGNDDSGKKERESFCCHECFYMRRFHQIFILFILMVIIFGMRTELGLAMLKINERINFSVYHIPNYNQTLNNTNKLIKYLQENHNIPIKSSHFNLITMESNLETITVGNKTYSKETLEAGVSYTTRRWSSYTVGFIESSFYLGYMIFSIPSGIIANTWSPKKFLAITIGISCSLNILIPSVVEINNVETAKIENPKLSFGLLFAFRVIQGMAEGSLYSSVQSIVSFWSPKSERSRMVTVILFGTSLGPIIGYPLVGFLIENYSWEIPFYIYGGLGLLWTGIWSIFFYETPMKDRYIYDYERRFITKTAITNENTKRNIEMIPWKSILSSLPVWAILLANLGRNWIFQFSFTGLPRLIKDVSIYEEQNGGYTWSKSTTNQKGIDEATLGQLMLIPFISMTVLIPISGILADFLISRNLLSVKNTRKFLHTVSYSICAFSLLALAFVRVVWLAMIFVTIALGTVGLGSAGFGANHLDIGPIYTGVIMGLSNAFGTCGGIISSIMARVMVHGHDLISWSHFFFLSFALECFCVIFFFTFASGDIQPWAIKPIDKDSEPIKQN